jgi:uncharacterized circularly permuted ATP-grasp superfamily protein
VLQDVINTYHDLLTDQLAADSQAMLDAQQPRRRLAFGPRPLCTALRPRFLTPQQYRFLQTRVAVLMTAFNRCHDAAMADRDFRAQYRLRDAEESLLAIDPCYPCPMPTSRLDAFFVSEDELKFTEYNAECPAGAAYGDGLADLFYALPVMREFLKRYRVVPLPCAPGVYHTLLDSFRRWSGTSEAPRIAILDWKEVPTYNEFVLFQQYFRANGLDCVIADPREVEYRDGRLIHGAFHVTLIYKRVLISELIERGGMNHPVIRALRDGAVCMVNPFRCKVLYKKASLAVLSDERNRSLFTPEQQAAIDAHVPWTRVVEDRYTEIDGQKIELVPYVHGHRERFVLKPNDDYGGKGIVLGWTVDDATWEQAVRAALAEPYVVQERVRLPQEPFPSFVDGSVRVTERLLDTAPFVSYGAFADGCLTRIATDPLLNVTAGGGSTVCTFIVEPR